MMHKEVSQDNFIRVYLSHVYDPDVLPKHNKKISKIRRRQRKIKRKISKNNKKKFNDKDAARTRRRYGQSAKRQKARVSDFN